MSGRRSLNDVGVNWYKILVGKTWGKRSLGRDGHSWENNMKLEVIEFYFKKYEQDWEFVDTVMNLKVAQRRRSCKLIISYPYSESQINPEKPMTISLQLDTISWWYCSIYHPQEFSCVWGIVWTIILWFLYYNIIYRSFRNFSVIPLTQLVVDSWCVMILIVAMLLADDRLHPNKFENGLRILNDTTTELYIEIN